MFDQNCHLTDDVLIQMIDGEASITDTAEARAHCAECLACRSRRSQLEQALSKFADLYSSTVNPQMSESSLERRAELKDRLATASLESPTSWLGRFTQYRGYLFVAGMIIALTIAALFRTSILTQDRRTFAQKAIRLLPDKALTPGATQPVNLTEVCSQQQEDLDPAVSVSVRKIVFQEYGMNVAKEDGYQVDYLINPQLGGTNDIRNLWPEPNGSTVWNAHAKDALEDRLHRMVCDKQIDLASAQQEIATDWIAAYKKYFHSENPS
jgi:hypothetical protein